MDVRSRRTRQRLAEAITAVGARVRLEEMTVDDVVTASGLSKSTVYRHAKSPAAFMADRLRHVLHDALVGALAQQGPEMTTAQREQANRRGMTALWQDGADHFEMYRRSASQPDSVILGLMQDALLAAITDYLRENLADIELPPALQRIDPDLAVDVLALQYSYGVVGLLKALLGGDELLPLESFIELGRDLMPRWQRSLLGLEP